MFNKLRSRSETFIFATIKLIYPFPHFSAKFFKSEILQVILLF